MSPGEKVNILLVDDQPAKLLSYEVILSELGENLIKANSANEALQHLLRNEIAVVLIDVCMPDLDGFELAAMIREHPRFQRTAIIFVSAIQMTDLDLLRGYEAGAVDYVPVPVVPELLRAKVRVFADLYRKTRQLELLNGELERRVEERTAELAQANAELEQRVEERTREREAALAQVHEMQKLESLGQLTGGVAHDFNNLLMVILGNLQLLRKRLPDDPRLLRLIDGAMQGAERGATLTKRMLAFARRQELRPETVDVPRLVQGMEEMLRRTLGPSIQIITTYRPDLPAIRVDPNQLELALLNLALNARDAMPYGGRLVIGGRRVTSGDAPKELGSGQLCVPDGVRYRHRHGRGDAEARDGTVLHHQGRRQGHRTRPVDGAWSGGAIGRRDADHQPGRRRHHGGAVAAGRPRQPLVAKSDRPRRHCSAVSGVMPRAGGGRRSAGCREHGGDAGGSRARRDRGTVGARALDLLRHGTKVDVVVTDHAMPGMTGAELARQIRQRWPDLPVILATGYAELPNGEDPGLPRLSKPYQQDELAAQIAKVVNAAPTNVIRWTSCGAPEEALPHRCG